MEYIKENENYDDKKAVNKLLIKYMKVLPNEVIENAIDMYNRKKSYEKIVDYLELELEQRQGKIDDELER